jgi:hypothetical protein
MFSVGEEDSWNVNLKREVGGGGAHVVLCYDNNETRG